MWCYLQFFCPSSVHIIYFLLTRMKRFIVQMYNRQTNNRQMHEIVQTVESTKLINLVINVFWQFFWIDLLTMSKLFSHAISETTCISCISGCIRTRTDSYIFLLINLFQSELVFSRKNGVHIPIKIQQDSILWVQDFRQNPLPTNSRQSPHSILPTETKDNMYILHIRSWETVSFGTILTKKLAVKFSLSSNSIDLKPGTLLVNNWFDLTNPKAKMRANSLYNK